jgi:hypothetical protein
MHSLTGLDICVSPCMKCIFIVNNVIVLLFLFYLIEPFPVLRTTVEWLIITKKIIIHNEIYLLFCYIVEVENI